MRINKFLKISVLLFVAAAVSIAFAFFRGREEEQTVNAAPDDIVFTISFLDNDGNPNAVYNTSGFVDLFKLGESTADYTIHAETSNGQSTDIDVAAGTEYKLLNSSIGSLMTTGGAESVTFTVSGYNGDHFTFTKHRGLHFARTVITADTGIDVDYNAPSMTETYYHRGNYQEAGTSVDYPLVAGTDVDIDLYAPATLTGTVSFGSVDDLIPDNMGFVYNFNWQFSAPNTLHIENMYWTSSAENDQIIHRGEQVSSYNTYVFRISIPYGETVTLHNIPVNATMSHYAPPNSLIGGAEGFDGVVTINGQRIAQQDPNFDFLSEYMVYTIDGAEIDDVPMRVVSSGYIGDWNWANGFNINVMLERRYSELVFNKIYDPNDTMTEPQAEHHFRVTLTDGLSGTAVPYANKPIAVSFYTDQNARLDSSPITIYRTDSNGVLDISVPAGTYVRLGRSVPRDFASAEHPYHSYETGPYSPYAANAYTEYGCFTDIGMLPWGITYTIEEISDSYEASVTGDTTGTTRASDARTIGIVSQAEYARDEYNYLNNIISNLSYYTGLTAPTFTNSRLYGSLTVEKEVVNDDDNDDPFDLLITLSDATPGFPTQFDTVDQDGNAGTITFTLASTETVNGVDVNTYEASVTLHSGESITINDIPAGAEYSVTEDAASSVGFTVTYTDEQGVITQNGSTATVTNTWPTPTPTEPTTTPTDTPADTPTPTATDTPSEITTTDTPTPTPSTVTPTPTDDIILTVTPTDTATPTPTDTPTPTTTTSGSTVARTDETVSAATMLGTIMIVSGLVSGAIYISRKRDSSIIVK